MHNYVYVRQFGKGKNNQPQGRIHDKVSVTFGKENADLIEDMIRNNPDFAKDLKDNKLKYTIDDNGTLTTSNAALLEFVKNNAPVAGTRDTATFKGKIANDLAAEVPGMCSSIIRAIVNRIGSHITDAKVKQRAKESNGDFTYIAPSLGKAGKVAQEQAKKRIEVASRNKAVRGYSTSPKTIRNGTVLKHQLLDTELEIVNVDRINTDGSIDVTYKFGDLGAFDSLKNNPNMNGEDNITLTQEDLKYYNVA